MTQVETTDPVVTAPPQSPPGLVDVKIDKPSAFRVSFVIPAAFGGFLLVLLVLLIARSLSGLSAYLSLAGFSIVAVVGVVLENRRKHAIRRREFRRLVWEKKPAEAAAYLASHISDEGPNKFTMNLLAELVAHRAGVSAMRVHWTQKPTAIEPLIVSFTPASLNESDEQFVQLADATSKQESAQEKPDGDLRVAPEDSAIGRLLRRNLRLKGGRLMLGILVFNFVFAAIEAYGRWRLTFGLVMWSATIAMYLFASPTGGPLRSKEWLIVPGGLLLRKQGKDRTKSDLDLFSPQSSMLLALQTRKETWSVIVTDGNRKESVILTSHEADMALRAWLSPIPPPSVEKLVDLT
ncbi:hypothetical protein B7486_09335 [cyanobacterium TDX16]|nr:hypothetical protein B7486_09335 [cyanobacterium TDX16]